MQLSNIPGKLVLPFANAGGKSTIPVASQIGITAGAASLTDGFPPLTRTPIAAGGVPPSGLDMNGILYEMSAIIRWANAGGGYPFDGTFATDTNIVGYPKGARIMRSDGTGYWFNTVENNTTDPESTGAAAAGWVPDYQSGATSIAMAASSVTLMPSQYGKPLIVITGTLTANLNLIFPAIVGNWAVINNTTGAFSITAKTSGGVGTTLTQGCCEKIVGNGTDIYSITAKSDASRVTYLAPWTGSVLNSLAVELQQTVRLVDFGSNNVPGSTDMTAAMQSAVAAGSATQVTVDLGGQTVSITTVNMPNAKAVTIKNGNVIVAGAGSAGFSKVTTVSPQTSGIYALYDMIFDGINFVRSVTGGSCCFMNLAWQDSTAGIVVLPNCNFQLTNGAVGVRLARSYGNNINGRFNMDGTSTGLLVDASQVMSGDSAPSCPINSYCNAIFEGGIGFNNLYIPSSQFNGFEGFTFGPGAFFYASKFSATKYNLLQFMGTRFVSAHVTLDSGLNTLFNGGYADRLSGSEGSILTFKTTVRDLQNIIFAGGFNVNAQGSTGANLVTFTDAGTAAGAQITNVVFGDMYFVCGVNNVATPVAGVDFNHAAISTVSVTDGCSFQAMYTCLAFSKPITRSSITRFTTRDITNYATGIAAAYAGGYNKFDPIYQQFSVDLLVPYYIPTVAAEPIFKMLLTYPSMMVPPVATITNQNSYFGAGYFSLTAAAGLNQCEMALVKAPTAPGGGRGGCSGLVTLDASVYSAPW